MRLRAAVTGVVAASVIGIVTHAAFANAVVGLRTPALVGKFSVPATLLFDFNPSAGSGASNLSGVPFVASGVTLDTVLSCNMTAATTGSVVCAKTGGTETMTKTGGGTPTIDVAVPLTAGDGVTFSSTTSDEYNAASSSVGNVTTEDFVVAVLWANSTTNDAVFGKKDTVTGTDAGWVMRHTGTGGQGTFTISDGSAAAASFNVPVNSTFWNLDVCFIKRNHATGGRCFRNGTGGTAGSTTAFSTNSIGNAFTMAIGGSESTDTAADTGATVAFVGLYKCPAGNTACLDTAGYSDAALTLTQRISGTWPATAAGSGVATSLSRNSNNSFVDIANTTTHVRTLFPVGNNWPRVVRRREDTGGEYATGFLTEIATTNLILRNEEFDNASWTKTNCAASANTTASPISGSGLVADSLESTDGAGSVEHFARQAVTLAASVYTASVFFDLGTEASFVWVRDQTVANAIAWFSTSTCATGTVGAGLIQAHSTANWASLECRVGITFTGTVASHNLDFGYSNADNVTAYDDGTDSTVDAVLWGAQVEIQPRMTSFIPTVTTTVTRSGDSLQYSSTSQAATTGGTLEVVLLAPNYDTQGTLCAAAIATSTTDRVAFSNRSNDVMRWEGLTGSSSQFLIEGTGDSSLGEIETWRGLWASNNGRAFLDGALVGTPDAVVTIPASFTTISPGSCLGLTPLTGAVISRVRVLDMPKATSEFP